MTKKMIRRDCFELKSDGDDIFVVFNGTRIAKRGRPDTSEAMTWVMLRPGWTVTSSPDHKKIVVWRSNHERTSQG